MDSKGLVCIAQHIKAYVEQCKHDEKADFSQPCIDCRFNQNCDFDPWPHFNLLREKTGVEITPLLTKRDKGYVEPHDKSDSC